jgi:hypothetical protein
MKKYSIILFIALILSLPVSACSVCQKVESAWDSFWTWIERKACEHSQFHYKRITGQTGICEHNGKHQNK